MDRTFGQDFKYLTDYKESSGIEQLHLGQALSSYLAYDVQLCETLHAVVKYEVLVHVVDNVKNMPPEIACYVTNY